MKAPLQYDSQYPLYGISFSHSPFHPYRIALTSLLTGPTNKLLTIDLTQTEFIQKSQANLPFPATKVGFEPLQSLSGQEDQGGRGELLATTGDVLRIWEMNQSTLTERSVLTNSKSPASGLPPITSFSWNSVSPNSIVTCSIDTTATLWDINTSQALTQLIAHDRAVYDLSWLPDSSDIFVSVGADGSLRAFDLRTLEHSTILYETADQTPLARISFSNREQHMLACFGLDDSKTLILDMRSPGQPVAELLGHQGALGGIAWGAGGETSGSGGWIASCGDDSQLLIYDLTSPLDTDLPKSLATPSPSTTEMLPSRAWTAEAEINNLAYSTEGDWLGCVSGNRMSLLSVACT